MQTIEQDDTVDATPAELLAQDLLHRAVAGAPGAQPHLARLGRAPRLLFYGALHALDQALERFGRVERGFVRSGAEPQIDTDQHRAVHDRDPLFARGLVTVEMKHHVELASAR